MAYIEALAGIRRSSGWLAALRAAIERWLIGRYES
ncbi:hypothetical protein LDDCCGHA_4348 [Methylobacterium oxalidis]|nr:hypothetical protein LDDCCGHA_4348 [Methylobacterium oxalidis]